MRMRLLWALLPVIVGLSASPATAASIAIQDGPCSPPSGTEFCFNPPSQAAASGEHVTWTNQSAFAPHHIVRCTPSACAGKSGGTGGDSWAGSGVLNPGATYTHAFTGAGTYVYYCSIHGYAAMHGTITVTSPVPKVTSLAPDAGPAAGGNTVLIHGSAFVPVASVRFGTTPSASVTFVSSAELKALVPTHASGVVGVRVTTPAGSSAASNNDLYAYGAPKISSFAPSSGITGRTITITGINYVPRMTLKFGTLISPSVTFVSTTQVRAVIPNGDAVAAKISVSDNAGSGSSATNFTPTLSITGFSPTGGPGRTVVRINGIGFNADSTAKFNGIAADTTFVSSSRLNAAVPATATTGPITVTNTAAPTGTVRSAGNFTVG
jgi:plastocyanin